MKKGRSTGAKAVVKGLENNRVKVVFGYPGGAILPVYDELGNSEIRHILVRHEQGAAHMADGYARSTGEPGVCMATSGPGAVNLVTGLATAYMDSSAVLAITGQVPRNMIGNDAFQEVDITGITIPITKHNYLVQQAVEVLPTLEEALFFASTGRKGPVLIDLPKDVQTEEFALDRIKRYVHEGYSPTFNGHPGQIKKVASLLKKADRPLIVAGGGVTGAAAWEDLLRFAEKTQIPVVHTLMGKSSFPNDHPLYLGLVGYHGRVASNTAVSQADGIVAVGTRFGDRSTGPLASFAENAKIAHIDIDPAEISKNVASFLPIVGNAKQILSVLADIVEPMNHTSWIAQLKKIEEEHPLRGPQSEVSPITILRKIRELVDDAIFVTDVGRHQIYAAHYLPVKAGRTFITSGGLGTMGFGVPASVGVKAGNPDKKVICISGDGSFMMTCQEIATAVEEDLPVIVLVFNDYCLGMVQQLQDEFYNKRLQACGFGKNVDFARLAESMGALGIRVEKGTEIVPALEKALESDHVCVIDFVLEEASNVYPMVKGSSLLDFVE